MIKFNPIGPPFDFTGQGGGPGPVSADNFSYNTIISGKTVTIPNNQQMLYKGILRIQGTLKIVGLLTSVEDDNKQMGQWNPIPDGVTVLIPPNRVMFFKNILRIYGNLRIHGIAEALS